MNCPTCTSESTQKIELAVMSGTTTGKSTAVGINTNLDVGVARIGTTSETSLAKLLNPGPKPVPPVSAGCFISMSLLLFIPLGAYILYRGDTKFGSIILGTSVLLLVIGYVLKTSTGVTSPNHIAAVKLKEWEKKNDLFTRGWICLRCGHKWLPS